MQTELDHSGGQEIVCQTELDHSGGQEILCQTELDHSESQEILCHLFSVPSIPRTHVKIESPKKFGVCKLH